MTISCWYDIMFIMLIISNRRYGRRQTSELLLRNLIIDRISEGRGNDTLMIASPNDPTEKVPKQLWYEVDGIIRFDVVWESRYIHPTKTFYNWAKELGYEV